MDGGYIDSIRRSLSPIREKLVDHPVYGSISDIGAVRRFMEHHVFAVWDFMSLLTYLKRHCSCVDVPWVPKGEPTLRRLINEIVCEEESDQLPNRRCASHYELYLEAMYQAGADTRPIERFVGFVQTGCNVTDALKQAQLSSEVQAFVQTTFEIIESDKPHAVASAFTFGREDLIPEMFAPLVAELAAEWPGKLDSFAFYLNRHIELDGAEHGPLAIKLVSELCGNDSAKWHEAKEFAAMALDARLRLWDAILEQAATANY